MQFALSLLDHVKSMKLSREVSRLVGGGEGTGGRSLPCLHLCMHACVRRKNLSLSCDVNFIHYWDDCSPL